MFSMASKKANIADFRLLALLFDLGPRRNTVLQRSESSLISAHNVLIMSIVPRSIWFSISSIDFLGHFGSPMSWRAFTVQSFHAYVRLKTKFHKCKYIIFVQVYQFLHVQKDVSVECIKMQIKFSTPLKREKNNKNEEEIFIQGGALFQSNLETAPVVSAQYTVFADYLLSHKTKTKVWRDIPNLFYLLF